MDQLWGSWDVSRIVWEDDAVLVVDKPAGLSCHPSDNPDVADIRERVTAGREGRVWLVQPIDAAMSGLVVFAKTKESSRALAKQVHAGIARTHVAVVAGNRGPAGFSSRVLQTADGRSLIEVGSDRRSQPLRRALEGRLVGDSPPAHRVMLHLSGMEITHPDGSALSLRAPLPAALERALVASNPLPDTIDELTDRLRLAADLRWGIATGGHDAFRIAHSGGDELPGIEVDRYRDHAVVSLRSDEAIARREIILDAVAKLGFAGVYLKVRRPHASVLVDTRTDAVAPADAVRGKTAPQPLIVHENAVPLRASLGDGLSTGIFLDQREGRRWLMERSATSVLNLFAYHGAFTVAAIVGGAQRTTTVDVSRVALAAAQDNLALVDADASAHEIVKADVMSWLRGAVKHRRQYDVVVLDPPSFSTTKKTTFRADRDYEELAARAMKTVSPGGALLACTNHRGIVLAKFEAMLARAATAASVTPQKISSLADPNDFPPEPGSPCHLKRVVVEL